MNLHPPPPFFLNHADAQTSNTSTRPWLYYMITKIHPPNFVVRQVLKFFDQDFPPQRCGCGEAVTFHVSSLVEHLRVSGCEKAKAVTDHSLRFFIKERENGCVG